MAGPEKCSNKLVGMRMEAPPQDKLDIRNNQKLGGGMQRQITGEWEKGSLMTDHRSP